MTATPRRPLRLIWTLMAVTAVAALALAPAVRAPVAQALAHVNLRAVLAAVPGQVGSLLLCAAALRALAPDGGFGAALGSRLLRDAGGNLLAVAPGLGELAGARALVLAGGGALAAVSVSAIDVLAETVAQAPFAAAGLLATARRWPGGIGRIGGLVGLALAVAVVALLAASRTQLASAFAARLRRALARLRPLVAARPSAFVLAVGLHAGAWAMGGVQVWCVAGALGRHLPLASAILLESVVYAARAAAFVAPAGLGVQEAAFMAAGLAFGLRPEEGLAISLALRGRDLLFGAPALAAWPLLELWRARRLPV